MDGLELEHIMHRSDKTLLVKNEDLQKCWMEESNKEKLLNRVGNLCLLKEGDNASAGSKPLEDKRIKFYLDSDYTCTKSVPEQFSPEVCKKREEDLLGKMQVYLRGLVLRPMSFEEIYNEMVIFKADKPKKYHRSGSSCKTAKELQEAKVRNKNIFCCVRVIEYIQGGPTQAGRYV